MFIHPRLRREGANLGRRIVEVEAYSTGRDDCYPSNWRRVCSETHIDVFVRIWMHFNIGAGLSILALRYRDQEFMVGGNFYLELLSVTINGLFEW